MLRFLIAGSLSGSIALSMGSSLAAAPAAAVEKPHTSFGRLRISTIPFSSDLVISSATYTPSGKVLVTYTRTEERDRRHVNIAVMDDDGRHLRTIFSGRIPDRAKDNGLRYMVFSDNKRVFMGDFVLECAHVLDICGEAKILPVQYPAEVASGAQVAHRWSEPIVAPDNQHVGWTTLLANYTAVVFVGELQKTRQGYTIIRPRIVSTLNPFHADPAHPDGVIPEQIRGGEVKQFVQGGTGISMAGSVRRDLPASVVQSLASGRVDAITDVPGYTETTIFSPDERLGITMSTRFSPHTDPAVLGLLPRPYPAALNMGLSMFAYTYAVTGVRNKRNGEIGPVLIDVARSKAGGVYRGENLSTDHDWVFHSPMSWHPGGKRAMWIEGRRSGSARRIQIVRLSDYKPAKPIPTMVSPDETAFGTSDMAQVDQYATTARNVDVKVYGRKAGFILYRRTPTRVEKIYDGYSDGGHEIYSGHETLEENPSGRSTYSAKIDLSGPKFGTMDLKVTFGPLRGKLPSEIIFGPDASGTPLSHGFAQYDGRRMEVGSLLP